MPKLAGHNRRAFLRALGAAPARAEGARKSGQEATTDETADPPPQPKSRQGEAKPRELSKRQFGLRSLFYVTLVVAVLLGIFGKDVLLLVKDIVRAPLLSLGILLLSMLLALIQEGSVRLFDAFLWNTFSDRGRKGR